MTMTELDIVMTPATIVEGVAYERNACENVAVFSAAPTMPFITQRDTIPPELRTKEEVLKHYAKRYGILDARAAYNMLTMSWKNYLRCEKENIELAHKGNNRDYYLARARECQKMKRHFFRIREELVQETMQAAYNLQVFIATGSKVESCKYCRKETYSGQKHQCPEDNL